jgi:hypothetical protein
MRRLLAGQAGYSNAAVNFNTSVNDLTGFILRNTIFESTVSTMDTLLPKGNTNGSTFGWFAGYISQWEGVTLGFEVNYKRGCVRFGFAANRKRCDCARRPSFHLRPVHRFGPVVYSRHRHGARAGGGPSGSLCPMRFSRSQSRARTSRAPPQFRIRARMPLIPQRRRLLPFHRQLSARSPRAM